VPKKPALSTEPAAPGRKFLAVGPYCWGQSSTQAEAVKQCKKASPGPTYLGKLGFRCIVFDAHSSVYLDDMGGICYTPADVPEGQAPYTEVLRIGKF